MDKKKKRPQNGRNLSVLSLKQPSANYIYSVDDDLDELEQDMEREYLEGYNDALRYRYKRSTKNLKDQSSDLQTKIVNNLINADSNIKILEQSESDSHNHHNHHSLYKQLDNSKDLKLNQLNIVPNSSKNIELEPTVTKNSSTSFNYNDDQTDSNDNQSISSVESFTLRERQNAINKTHPFGIRIWKPALYKKIRSVEREADLDIHEIIDSDNSINNDSVNYKIKKKTINWSVHLANLIWTLTFGLVLFTICFFGSILLMITELNDLKYSKILFNLAIYLLWPFGKIVYLQRDVNYLNEDQNEGTTIHEYQRWRDEDQTKLFFSPSNVDPNNASSSNQLQQNLDNDDRKLRFFGRGDWSISRIVFYLFYYILLQPVLYFIWLICWLLIITIPMSKVIGVLSYHLRRHPLAIFFKFDSYFYQNNFKKNSNILVCTYRSSGLHYWKYTVDGTNVILINLLFIVLFTILDFFILKEFLSWDSILTNESLIFALCLLSIIPLAYFIGQAVASISAQSSMGVGAVINAFFSTIVEIFLYCVALDQQKGLLVEGSMIGSILGGVLLLPGLSMCAGAFIRKTQRYNPASAGVSSTMLLFSICVMFAPTVFHQLYGSYEVKCIPCKTNSSMTSCKTCHFYQPPLIIDDLFASVLKPFSIICAILLFLAYTIGLWFTLRTHAALIWSTPIADPIKPKLQQSQSQLDQIEPEPQGHDSPNWSKQKSTIVLLSATVFYAIIAEILVDCVDSVLKEFPINPKFLGITIFALVPNTTEFLNAISFATHGNVALSLEIGSAYALQVCLIQIPSLVLYSIFNSNLKYGDKIRDSMFTLIFPNWDLIAATVSVGIFTYVYAEGKSNYFKGSILILIYFVVLWGFWFTGEIDANGGFTKSFIVQ